MASDTKRTWTPHGMTGTKIYTVWKFIKARCRNPKSIHYSGYGGRGIKISDDFYINFICFYNYLKTLPNFDKYISGDNYSLDRIDNDGHYEIGNLRFASISVQQKNKRIYKNNSSGYSGVCYHKGGHKYWAYVKENNKQKSLGLYNTAKEASEARNSYLQQFKTENNL